MSLKVKILLLLFLSAFPLNASILYSAKNICIEDYFINGNKEFCYKPSTSAVYDIWNCTPATKQELSLIPNYTFYPNTWNCKPNTALYYGLEQSQFNFLLALSGLLIGLIILVTSLYLVLNVGGKR